MKRTLLFLLLFGGFALSCEDILEVPDISGQQVELLAPSEGSVVTDSIVNFNWNGVNDADSYLVQVATPDFENAAQLVLDSVMVIDSTFVGTRISKQLSNSTYEWRVKAQNSGFETEFSISGFTVDASSN
ncbi:hypothetical protein [Allomuricauda sp. SCSIO 65647]|uniref:hypothetical protein n=1 Tax=Allomuricauda sp. SCSIO 65647 TaxID=2908843 RepID=UPI001F286BB5|nr:hypothetical protein [Muricauda sp. SCSIO 65647]UJH68665.1 hypothetical protein L0P89_05480 [Muricauda sp. SCSIO 65647]